MTSIDMIKDLAKVSRQWRDNELKRLEEAGCTNYSHKPRSGMSSVGWVLAHQAAIFDFSLNMLIKGGPPENPDMFKKYTPGTSGDWDGTSLATIQQYYDDNESALLKWVESASDEDLKRILKGENIPEYFRGMSVQEVIISAFVHLNYHTGHLSAIRRDWSVVTDI